MALVVGGNGVRTKLDKPAPFVINGDMVISQRSTSVTGIGDGDSGYHTIDRFRFEEGNTPAAVWTMTQESLSSGNAYNAGFQKALKMDCTTSDDLSNHGDILNVIKYATEQRDTHLFKKGTSNAEKYTVAFWIKATKTGTHTCELRDSTNDRAVSVAYTVSSSDTWEHKVLNFPADTTGATGTGTTKGLEIYWCLHHGGNYGSSSLQTSWGGSSTAARYTGQVNNADSTSNNWHLTGVQLEVGEYDATTIPPFQHENFGDNLVRCHRYYYKLKNDAGSTTGAFWGSGLVDSGTTLKSPIRFPKMRTKPSAFETTGSASDYRVWYTGNNYQHCSSVPTFDSQTSFSGRLLFTVSSGLTGGQCAAFRSSTNDAYLAWSAEL